MPRSIRRKVGEVTRLTLVASIALAITTGATAAHPSLKHLVLPLQALPAGFAINSTKTVTHGYVVVYSARQTPAQALTGPAEIDDAVNDLGSTAKARKNLAFFDTAIRKHGYRELSIEGARIGDEAHLFVETTKINGAETTFYVMQFRHTHYAATIAIVGVPKAVTASQIVRLAQQQDELL